MNHIQIQAFRRQLEQAAARLRPDVQTITDRTRSASGGQATTELSNAPMHLADAGTDEYLHELNATLLENEGFLLTEVDAALARLDDGTFGRCEHCDGAIARERLSALPHTRFCIRCAEHADQPQANLNSGRPQSPADTLADEDEMEIRGRDKQASLIDMVSSQDGRQKVSDVHAAGTPGGGSAVGGIAGGTKGDGVPELDELHEAMGSGDFDASEGEEDLHLTPTADHSGAAVERTPVTRR